MDQRADSVPAGLDSRLPLPVSPPRTPTHAEAKLQELLCEIREIHHGLQEVASLAPSELVNSLLTRLVTLCTKAYDRSTVERLLSCEEIRRDSALLRARCAVAEGELERFWARKFCSEVTCRSPRSASDVLRRFPYYENYVDLSRLESSLLSAYLPTGKSQSQISLKCAFLGSGSLPMSSWCLLDAFPGAHVHNIDRDLDALAISKSLNERLGYGGRASFSGEDLGALEFDATATTPWSTIDVVFLAALVGMHTSAKLDILRHLARRLRSGCLVVCRSARGMRTLLYPVLELSEEIERCGFEILIEVHPWTSVVNSVIILRLRDCEAKGTM